VKRGEVMDAGYAHTALEAGRTLASGRPVTSRTLKSREVRDGQEGQDAEEAEAAEDGRQEEVRRIRGGGYHPGRSTAGRAQVQEVRHASPRSRPRVAGALSSEPVSVGAGSHRSRASSAAIGSSTATRSCFHREARSEGPLPVRLRPTIRRLLPQLRSILTTTSTTTSAKTRWAVHAGRPIVVPGWGAS
jgi:hypothetical protein